MFFQNLFPKNNNIFLFIYLFLILSFLIGLLVILYRQIKNLIEKEQQFSKLQTSIQFETNVNFEQYLKLGILLLNKKLFGQAIKYLKLAIYNCDDIILLGNIYNNIGYCYFKQNNFSLAKYYYQEALIYLPDYVIALNNLAFLFESEKNYSKALELYEKSYKFDSSNLTSLKQKQKLQKILGKID